MIRRLDHLWQELDQLLPLLNGVPVNLNEVEDHLLVLLDLILLFSQLGFELHNLRQELLKFLVDFLFGVLGVGLLFLFLLYHLHHILQLLVQRLFGLLGFQKLCPDRIILILQISLLTVKLRLLLLKLSVHLLPQL